jgi:hypothetical protein
MRLAAPSVLAKDACRCKMALSAIIGTRSDQFCELCSARAAALLCWAINRARRSRAAPKRCSTS